MLTNFDGQVLCIRAGGFFARRLLFNLCHFTALVVGVVVDLARECILLKTTHRGFTAGALSRAPTLDMQSHAEESLQRYCNSRLSARPTRTPCPVSLKARRLFCVSPDTSKVVLHGAFCCKWNARKHTISTSLAKRLAAGNIQVDIFL